MRLVVSLLACLLSGAALWLVLGPREDAGAGPDPARAVPSRSGPPTDDTVLPPRLVGRPASEAPADCPEDEGLTDVDFPAIEDPLAMRAWSLRAGGLPPDPVTTGPCRLVLRFVDWETKEPVHTAWTLWHLDAPASAAWTRGDQLRAGSGDFCGEVLAVVEGLAEGTYRVAADAEGPCDEGPPAFRVAGPETEAWVEVRTPRAFRVRLQVRDPEGRLVTEGTCCEDWIASGTVTPPASPPWATPRRVKADGRVFEEETWCHWDGGGERPETVAVDAEGFFTDGTWREARRYERASTVARYRFEGTSEVRVSVEHDDLSDHCHLAVVAPLAWIRARIRHADGRPLGAEDEDLTVEAWCAAPRLPSAEIEEDAWRDLEISVRVERDGTRVGGGRLRPGDPTRLLYLPR